ncbi:hypothetical protein BST34_09680 [Mycolicibacterium monacense DSM 44395]|nr:hypothetical protein [Mycolicibacterium monacense DSM 44395]ORB21354.1 hypothetical protein BST34_09680 [Mycolicibacterium monacense DSM 44395]QHP84672.1 hypothetical protein EWR22_04460 [Mycolicibacterium monacense DSM 44395]
MMTQHPLSAADAALRERITELSVHIRCGGLRGPLQRRSPSQPDRPVRWQSCGDEDHPVRWEDADVSREHDLCIICFRGTAGGRSRWSWLACGDCRSVNAAIENVWGFRSFALGRHSLMNGIGVRSSAQPDVRARQIARLAEFGRGDDRLRAWRRREYQRLARSFDPLADIPLRLWQQEWPPSRLASRDAFARLIGPDFPLARP